MDINIREPELAETAENCSTEGVSSNMFVGDTCGCFPLSEVVGKPLRTSQDECSTETLHILLSSSRSQFHVTKRLCTSHNMLTTYSTAE